VHLIAKADAPQSEIRVGHVAVPRLHEDYFPLVVMNAILGGLFSSRLNLNLREAHAYTYGAHSAFDWRRAASPFEISTAVETAVTADALREISTEFRRIREAPVSATSSACSRSDSRRRPKWRAASRTSRSSACRAITSTRTATGCGR
jgi:zinc protease